MPHPSPLRPAVLRRPTSPQRRDRSRAVRPPWIAIVPLVAGFCAAVGAGQFLDADDEAQLTSAPQAPVSDVSAVPPPAPIAASGGAAPLSGSPAPLTPPEAPRVVTEATRDPALEAQLAKVLRQGRTPYAATVLLEVGTGRVLAIAEHSTRGPSEGLHRKPIAPAASIFKLVTSSALLRQAVPLDAKVCTHGGKTRMKPALLVDDARRDSRCATFGDVVPQSLNVAIAKLALKHLDPDRLRAEAARWGFGASFGGAVTPSTAHIPDDPFAFANAAAGFGDVKISALHGAMIAAAAVQDGVMIPPRFDDAAPDEGDPSRVLSADAAQALRRMMIDTVEEGTGRRSFQQAPRLGATAGGKTGSLTDYKTGLDTSWFVGFAPARNPRVAVASVVVNTAKWHIKAPTVAKEALRAYFQSLPKEERALVAQR